MEFLASLDVGFILQLLFALHGVALVVVNFTETPKDDEILAKVYRVIEMAAGLLGKKAKL